MSNRPRAYNIREFKEISKKMDMYLCVKEKEIIVFIVMVKLQ